MRNSTFKSIYYFAVTLLCIAFNQALFAQGKIPTCGSDIVQKLTDPTGGYSKIIDQQIQERLTEYEKNASSRPTQVNRVLPIIIHVINPTGSSLGIDDTRVDLALSNLNAAFENLSPYDPSQGVNTRIQFCKAQRTPSGLPSAGFEEVSSTLSDLTIENDDANVKALSRYTPFDYINVYVVNSISSLSSGPGVAGYAYFPTEHGSAIDGIVLEANYFGTSAENDAVLVHEMGHYLGLYHTFQGGCANADCTSDGDRVCDTPPDNSTARIPCTDSANTCNTDAQSGSATDLPDDTHNYMDYTTLACMVQFTAGQSDRMNAVIDNVRGSLLLSRGCISPCTTPLTGNLNLSAPPYVRGQTITATANVPGAVSYDWTLNQATVGASAVNSIALTSTGIQRLRLEATDLTGLCALVIDTTFFVACELDASFNVSPDSLSPGDNVTLTASSSLPTLYAYEVNGVSIGSTPVVNYTLPADGGTYQFCLTVANVFCAVDSCTTIFIPDAGTGCADCVEICDNGIDDDGDGYVDCYDVKCQCFDGEDCIIDTIPPLSFAARLGWTSLAPLGITPTSCPIIANLNPQDDRISEIIMHEDDGRGIYIFQGDGSNSANPDFLLTPQLSRYSNGSPGAADIDGDGVIELAIATRNTVQVYSNYQQGANPPVSLASTTTASLNSAACFADFNGDGFSEIYGAEALLHSTTNSITNFTDIMNISAGLELGENAIAADILRPIDCGGDPDCEGLEFISGSVVFSVDLSTTDGDGIEVKVQRNLQSQLPNNHIPQYSSVADIDLDGILDVVLTHENNSVLGVIVYDRNGVKWAYDGILPLGLNNVGSACVTELIDDTELGAAQNYPEFIIVSGHRITCFNLNAAAISPTAPYWWQQVVVDKSGKTGVTSFDFNGDGLEEIVYHDEESVRIVYGGNAPYPAGVDSERNYAIFDVGSLTADEIPLIADVDGDNEAEIISLGGLNDTQTSRGASVVIIESDPTRGSPWTNTRTLWNQREYSHVSINEDLTVPPNQQLPHLEFPTPGSGRRPFNRYLVQQPALDENYEPFIPVADVVTDLLEVSCSTLGYEIQFEVCNTGSRGLSYGTPIQVYGQDPVFTAATPVYTDTLPRNIEIGACDTLTFTLSIALNGDLFIVVNDNGSIPRPFSLLDDFPSTGVAECDYTNNIFEINLPERSQLMLDLGPDIAGCATRPQVLTVAGTWADIRWPDGSSDSTFTAPELGTYWVDVWNICGEKFTDTIQITKLPSTAPDLGPDLRACENDSVRITAGPSFANYRWFENAFEIGCDTCSSIVVAANQNKQITLTTTTVDGCIDSDSLEIVGIALPTLQITTKIDSCSTGTGSITATSDSLLNITIGTGPTQTTDSYSLGGLSAGTYPIFYTSAFCAQADSIEVQSTPAAFLALPPDTLLCYWDSLQVEAPLAAQYAWTSSTGVICSDCREISIASNASTQLSLTITDTNNCSASDTMNVTRSTATGVSTLQPICTPYTGGSAIFTSGPNVELRLNGNLYQGSTTVNDLEPNLYIYTLTEQHCVFTDSFTLQPLDSLIVEEQLEVCESTITEIGGTVYQGIGIAEELIENLDGCDTLRRVYLEPANDTTFNSIDTTICSTNILIYNDSVFDEAGVYRISENSDAYCPTFSDLTLWMQAPPEISQIYDTILNLGQSIELSAFISGKALESLRWQPADMVSCPDCRTTTLFATRQAEIILQVADSLGCEAEEKFQLQIRRNVIDAPSAFSPNGDNVNDFFTAFFAGGEGTIKKMQIFNRWGELVYTQVNFPGNLESAGWDGTQNGESLNPGVFVYLIEYEAIGGNSGTLVGDVTLTK